MDVRSHEATLLDTSGIIFPEGHKVTGVGTERQSDVKASGVTEGWERFEGAPRERIWAMDVL